MLPLANVFPHFIHFYRLVIKNRHHLEWCWSKNNKYNLISNRMAHIESADTNSPVEFIDFRYNFLFSLFVFAVASWAFDDKQNELYLIGHYPIGSNFTNRNIMLLEIFFFHFFFITSYNFLSVRCAHKYIWTRETSNFNRFHFVFAHFKLLYT